MPSSLSGSIDADDADVPSQLCVVEDSTLDESKSEATVDSDSLKRTHEDEAMVETKKTRPSDEEVFDLLMSKVLEAQAVSNYSDSLESSPLSSPSISEVSQQHSPENDGNFHDISEESDTEEESKYNSDESTSEITTSRSSITSPAMSSLSSQRTSTLSSFSCTENYTNILDESEDCDNEDPSELNRNTLTRSLQPSGIPPALNPSSSITSEAFMLNWSENDSNFIDKTEDSDVEEPINLDMNEPTSRLMRSLQPVSSITRTIMKPSSSSNISGVPLLNCPTNNTNIIDITGDNENGNPSKIKWNILIFQSTRPSKAISSVIPAVFNHPAPLPEAPQVESLESWKKMPPCPTLTVQLCSESRDLNKVKLEWNINTNGEEFAEITSYEIFYYEVIDLKKSCTNLWHKIDDVKAMSLSMSCILSCQSVKPCKNQYFAIRTIDKYSRVGQFSSAQYIELNSI